MPAKRSSINRRQFFARSAVAAGATTLGGGLFDALVARAYAGHPHDRPGAGYGPLRPAGDDLALPAGSFVDANNDALTYSLLVERPGYWETYYIAPGEPELRWVEAQWVAPGSAGLSINTGNGTITGTLSLLYGETAYRAKVIARDPTNAAVEAVFNVRVNRVPTSSATTESVPSNGFTGRRFSQMHSFGTRGRPAAFLLRLTARRKLNSCLRTK